jgi:hypothetical protein
MNFWVTWAASPFAVGLTTRPTAPLPLDELTVDRLRKVKYALAGTLEHVRVEIEAVQWIRRITPQARLTSVRFGRRRSAAKTRAFHRGDEEHVSVLIIRASTALGTRSSRRCAAHRTAGTATTHGERVPRVPAW